jgi:hypothetical protein
MKFFRVILFSQNGETDNPEKEDVNNYSKDIADTDLLDLKEILRDSLKDLRYISEEETVQEVEQVSKEKTSKRFSEVVQKTKNLLAKVREKSSFAKKNVRNFMVKNKIKILFVTVLLGTGTILFVIVGNKAKFLSFVSTKIK